ncbi:4-alpha-glucanotransferase DPE2 [Zea mays]|uniref:4-alpha-glucanotransferase n=1 Tax=Zea mays TaxID=4577 RepID=A0A1D6K2M0_MAIZE|nr:4-alpha-glucanotransferase DPE2 [Zea mays]
MERKGGCCLAPRYAATAAAQQAGAAWQMGRIMLKFRPIAPKPAAMAPAPAPAPVTGPAVSAGKGKRKAACGGGGRRGRKPKKAAKVAMVTAAPAATAAAQDVGDCRKHCDKEKSSSSPSSSSSGTSSVDSSPPPRPQQRQLATLPLMPETAADKAVACPAIPETRLHYRRIRPCRSCPKLLVDWAVNLGFHLVQLLPINDTSVHGMRWDSYPYSSLSVFALHPLYLRVQALSDAIPVLRYTFVMLSNLFIEEIQQAKKHLDKKDVDYEAALSTKLSIARKIFNLEKEKVLNSSSFQQFLSENELDKLISEGTLHHDVIRFHYYVQYHLYIQLSEAATYARKKNVILKGDLPIDVDRNSVDTWVYPTLFRMNTTTGAPLDYFDKNGQNWGFPTYN